MYQAFILAKYNGSIFELTQILYQDAGGQVDQGQRGVHHVGVGVVSLFALFTLDFEGRNQHHGFYCARGSVFTDLGLQYRLLSLYL